MVVVSDLLLLSGTCSVERRRLVAGAAVMLIRLLSDSVLRRGDLFSKMLSVRETVAVFIRGGGQGEEEKVQGKRKKKRESERAKVAVEKRSE